MKYKKKTEQYNLKYFETSAKTKKNINEGYDYIINKAFAKINKIKDVIDLKVINEEKSGCFGRKKKKKNNDEKSDGRKKSK